MSQDSNGLSKELQYGRAAEHYVVFDLLMQGKNAFLTEQGLPYDAVVDSDGKLFRIQVKSGTKRITRPGSREKYFCSLRRGDAKGDHHRSILKTEFDILAFVALDKKLIAYLHVSEIVSKDGKTLLQGIEFKDRDLPFKKYYKKSMGRYMQDYGEFKW
jgi:hypothetical protein